MIKKIFIFIIISVTVFGFYGGFVFAQFGNPAAMCLVTAVSWISSSTTSGDSAKFSVTINDRGLCNGQNIGVNIFEDDTVFDDRINAIVSPFSAPSGNQMQMSYDFTEADYEAGDDVGEGNSQEVYLVASAHGQTVPVQSSNIGFTRASSPPPGGGPGPGPGGPGGPPVGQPPSGGYDPNQGLSGSPGSDFSIQRVYGIIVGLTCWFSRIALVIMTGAIIVYALMMIWAGENASAFSDAKKSLMWAIVGALVVLGTYTIIASVVNFVDPNNQYITGINRALPINCSSGGQAVQNQNQSPVQPLPQPPIQPPIQPPPSGGANLFIDSIAPNTYSAGLRSAFNEQTGIVTYSDANIAFEIKGEGLTGATLSSNNIGTDGALSIQFQNLNVTDTSIRGTMLIKPTAKDGQTRITVTNGNKTATVDVNITITGTQYLKRKFANDAQVSFRGEWEAVMPDQTVITLESETRRGLNTISANSYKKLNLNTIIYEGNFFVKNIKTICAQDTKDLPPDFPYQNIGGCAIEGDNIIHIATQNQFLNIVDETLLHESAHKLHFYNLGVYRGVPGSPTTSTGFQTEWKTAAGTVNPSVCIYLPLQNLATWKDGTGNVPHCGFTRAYGASDLDRFAEDVATFTADFTFNNAFFSQSEPKSDNRYNQKTNILRKYEFIP